MYKYVTSKKIEPVVYIYEKVLVHMIMETEKFHQSAICKLEYRKDGGNSKAREPERQ